MRTLYAIKPLTICCIIVFAALVSFTTVLKAACNHMQASAKDKDICSTCSTSGPVAHNTGSLCDYLSSGSALLFCDCAANLNCKSSAGSIYASIPVYTGVCYQGLCVNATPILPPQVGWFVYKYTRKCTAG